MSSTPALSQSEVEEWTGQSPSAESWLVPQQQGSISERDKQAQMRRGRSSDHYGTQHADWIHGSKKHILTFYFLFRMKLKIAVDMDEQTC